MPEEIIDRNLEGKKDEIKITGSLKINGNVIETSIFTTGDIIINGVVINSKVITNGGNIRISKGIEGDNSFISAFGDIYADYCIGGNVESKNGSIYLDNRINNAKVQARNLVHVYNGEGIIEKACVKAGIEVITNILGNEDKEKTFVILSNERQQELFELIIIYENKLKEKKKKLEELLKVIKIIKLLGDNIVKLNQEKKEQLARQIKEYNLIKKEIEKTNEEKNKVMKRKEEMKRYTRAIIVNQKVYPNVHITIDKLTKEVLKSYEKVIFYKTGIVIMGDLDQFKLRQR